MSDIGHSGLEKQLKKNTETTFSSRSRFVAEKKKKKKTKTSKTITKRYTLVRVSTVYRKLEVTLKEQ